MIKKCSIPLNLRQIQRMNEKGKLNFDLAVQRVSNLWSLDRKSLLIHSLIEGYPIPPVFAKTQDNIYYFIDGKQRLTSILAYLNDEFSLTESTHDVSIDINNEKIISIKNLKFSQLPEDIQHKLYKSTILMYIFDKITNVQIEEMFFRLNNGVALRPIEKIRVLLGENNLKIVSELSNHNFLKFKSNVSFNRYTNQEVILAILVYMNNPNKGLGSSVIKEYVNDIKDKSIDSTQIQRIKEVFNYLDKSYEKKRRYLKKVNMPILFKLAEISLESNVKSKYFSMWTDDFFRRVTKEDEYYIACQSGSSKKENVLKRQSIIDDKFKRYFQIE